MPSPDISFTSSGSAYAIFRSATASRMLTAIGWVEAYSALAAHDKICSCVNPSLAFTDSTLKFPSVIVPVLSITIALISASISSAAPPLNKIPLLEPAPIPAKNASGTLNTSAHGQLIIKKDNAV